MHKTVGGLGLRKLDKMSRACIMKLGWRLKHNPNDLWCKVLVMKYGLPPGGEILPHVKGQHRIFGKVYRKWMIS